MRSNLIVRNFLSLPQQRITQYVRNLGMTRHVTWKN